MRHRISFSSPERILGLGAIVLAPALGAGQGVRPPVTIDVRIDGALYRSRLSDTGCTARCDQLRRALRDSVRGLFQRSFGYLDWRAAPQASPDTVVVAWTTSARQDGELSIAVLGRQRAARQQPLAVPFEPFITIATRPATDWLSVAAMRTIWLTRLDEVLRNPSEAQAITSRALVHVPLRPLVNLDQMPKAMVRLSPRAIRANPARGPVFLVRMNVIDPDDVPLADARQDTTEASLDKCSQSADGGSYVCRVQALIYPGRTPPDTVAEQARLTAIAKHTRRQLATLHLWTFIPEDRAADAPARPR
jgi:hypothetical protein